METHTGLDLEGLIKVGRIILEWILNKSFGKTGLDLYGSGSGQVVSCCDKSYELSCYIERGGISSLAVKLLALQIEIFSQS